MDRLIWESEGGGGEWGIIIRRARMGKERGVKLRSGMEGPLT
jgi:hypothetical protein